MYHQHLLYFFFVVYSSVCLFQWNEHEEKKTTTKRHHCINSFSSYSVCTKCQIDRFHFMCVLLFFDFFFLFKWHIPSHNHFLYSFSLNIYSFLCWWIYFFFFLFYYWLLLFIFSHWPFCWLCVYYCNFAV